MPRQTPRAIRNCRAYALRGAEDAARDRALQEHAALKRPRCPEELVAYLWTRESPAVPQVAAVQAQMKSTQYRPM
jgi:hypothetical protein